MSNQAKFKNILSLIADLPFEDQRMLNKLLVAELKAGHKEAARDAAADFRVGQIVTFDAGPRKGGLTKIQIIGFSRDMSTIKGKQIGGFREGIQWNVAATFCKA